MLNLNKDLTGADRHDPVEHPSHYCDGGIETIDFIEAKGLPYHLGNAVKYISRAGKKDDELQDLRKARWYLNRYIQLRERELLDYHGPGYGVTLTSERSE